MFQFLKKMLGMEAAPAANYREMLDNGALIVDVRTPAEYKGGHIKGSVNIPLDSIGGQTDSLLKKGVPIITCCRSGARSGMAVGILRKAGIEAVNGGAWDGLQTQL
jgi:phage shock protein E